MKLMKRLVLAAVVAFAVSGCHMKNTSTSDILSGVQEGNGGDAVVCKSPDGTITSVVSFDLYEASVLRGIFPDLGDANLDPIAKLELALTRFERLDPERANRYLETAQQFMSNARLVPDYVLLDIQDSNHQGLKAGCVLEQLVAYMPPKFPQDKPYIVSKDLWEHLDNENKAAVILHEIVYRELKEHGATDSTNARYFNSLILSKDLEGYTKAQYINLLKLIDPAGKIPLVYYGAVNSKLIHYLADDENISMRYIGPSPTDSYGPPQKIGPHLLHFRQPESSLTALSNAYFGGNRDSSYQVFDNDMNFVRGEVDAKLSIHNGICRVSQTIGFYPGTYTPKSDLECIESIKISMRDQKVSFNKLSLDKDGNIISGYVVHGSKIKVAGDRYFPIAAFFHRPFHNSPEYWLTTFYTDGALKSAMFYPEKDLCFLKAGGGEACFVRDSGTVVTFDEDGYVIEN